MTQRKEDSILQKTATAVVLADVSDEESIALLGKLLVELLAHYEASGSQSSFKNIRDCISLLEGVIDGTSEDTTEDIDVISLIIAELQQRERLERHGREEQKSVPSGEIDLGDNDFVLPSHIEEETFREFVAKQKHVLDDIEADILAIERGSSSNKAELRRRIHTMKGEAGLIGLFDLELVCHKIEDLMEKFNARGDWTDQLLIIKDWMASATDSYARGVLPVPRGGEVIANVLSSLPGDADEGEKDTEESSATEEDTSDERIQGEAADQGTEESEAEEEGSIERDEYTIELCADFIQESEEGLNQVDAILINVEEDGATPELINTLFRVFHTIKGLSGFLEFKSITELAHTTETLLNMVRDGKVALADAILDLIFDSTALMRKMIAAVHEAVEASSDFTPLSEFPLMLARLSRAIEGSELPRSELPEVEPGRRLGEILTQAPLSVSAAAIEQALENQKESGRKLGEELITQGVAKPKQVAQALRAQKQANQRENGAKIRETIKVDLERVDSLVEMIGELVVVDSMVLNSPEIMAISSQKVRKHMSQLGKITRDLQDVGMRMRMVPVRGVFQKMTRMVRDLSRKSSKRVRMVTNGEATEMDRSMVEQIADPLVHMIRNSVDHGIETEKDRTKAGKDPVGTVKLSAYHQGGSIVIEVTDDGKGLDREAILAKAREKRLVKEEQIYSENETYNLIFAPGFSTAKQVTDISGRGVGMDVVKKNIDGMRGRISISSEPGHGTSFKIVLPLTLAIIEGMLVACGNEKYIIPTLSIIESIQPTPSMFVTFAEQAELLNVRGEIIPLIRLDRLFGVRGSKQSFADGLVVIVEGMGRRFGLFVDDVLNQQQVVIKTLGEGLKDVQFISGAAILSDGKVGLIFNIDEASVALEQRALKMKESSATGAVGAVPLDAEMKNIPGHTLGDAKGGEAGKMEGVQ